MIDEPRHRRLVPFALSVALHVSVLMAMSLGERAGPTPADDSHGGGRGGTAILIQRTATPPPNRATTSPDARGSLYLAAQAEASGGHRKTTAAAIAPVARHLLESTLFATAVGLLTFAFRRNRAAVRYWLWFCASVKFLVPFALIVALGREFAPVFAQLPRDVPATISLVGGDPPDARRQAASRPATLTAGDPNVILALAPFGLGVWACGFGTIILIRVGMWRHVRALVASSSAVAVSDVATRAGIEVRLAPGWFEPGVVGWWRPVILLPAGIERHLTPAQLEAVLEHELCHIRRRDNLTAAVHMLVEAVCWFHPLAWWVGARLIDERERACDEHVVESGAEPREYAQSILETCRYHVQSSLACVAGVTSADLAKRIDAIVSNRTGGRLGSAKKLVLWTAAMLVVGVPLGRGLLGAPAGHAQPPASAPQSASVVRFEVASIRPNHLGSAGPTEVRVLPGGRYVATNMPVRLLIGRVYGVSSVRLLGGPSWIESEHFDIAANLGSESIRDVGGRSPPIEAALRTLLEDRFNLVVHTETRQMPIYHLVLARRDGRLGPNLTRSSRTDCEARLAAQASAGGPPPPPPGASAQAPPCGVRSLVGRFWVDSVPLTTVAALMTGEVGRVVLDKTGLTGRYTGHLTWTPFQAPNLTAGSPDDVQSIDPNGVSVFSAVQEQLGLELQAATGPVEVLVIDSIERPTPD